MNLRPYQEEAVAFLRREAPRGAILADAMRLGKSASAIVATRDVPRLIIVCPSYVREVWAGKGGELEKWSARRVWRPYGLKPKPIPEDVDCLVLHYEIAAAWSDTLCIWSAADESTALIIDECHVLANEKTARSKAVRAIENVCSRVIGLTGTPLTNSPRDLWNVVDTIRRGHLGAFFPYAMRYCAAHQEAVTPTKVVWDFSGSSNLGELQRRLAPMMLRRTAADVALQLPNKVRQTVWFDVPAAAAIVETENRRALRAMLDRSADAKLEPVAEHLCGLLAERQKLVVFCHRRAVADMLAAAASSAGFAADVVHGGISAVRRGAAIAAAKEAPGAHLLACTIDTCSTGIDLSYADGACFAELTYEPHELLQAEARLINYGTPKPTFVTYFLARGSIDEIIAERVIGKLDVFERVIGTTGENLTFDAGGEDAADEIMRAVLSHQAEATHGA